MKRKPALLLCVLFLFLLLLTSCGKSTTEGAYSAVDARGKTVSLSHEPRRILTDSLHLDETLLTVVPKSHLAGAYYLDGEPGLSCQGNRNAHKGAGVYAGTHCCLTA